MRALAPSRQDPDGLCGSPGVPGPVRIPPELARIWAGEAELPRTAPGVATVQGVRRETPPALPFLLGPAAVVGALLLVTAWRRFRRRGAGAPPPVTVEEAAMEIDGEVDAGSESRETEDDGRADGGRADGDRSAGAEVIPIRSRHRRRKGEEKPAEPIVVPLGGRRPSAPPLTVRLPSHTASLLGRPAKPEVRERPVAEEPDEAPRQPTQPEKRSGRSWWVMD